MPTIKTIKIYKKEDLKQLSDSLECHIEVYLQDANIPLKYIYGDLIIRAKHCFCPNLLQVDGRLSIDAEDAYLPFLERVNGSVNIHEKFIQVPVLEIIMGDLEIHNDVNLMGLKMVIGRIVQKGIKIDLSHVVNNQSDSWVEIKTQSDVDKIEGLEFRNIIIDTRSILGKLGLVKPLQIDLENIYGSVSIFESSCVFPNLKKIGRTLKVHSNNKFHSIETPNLKEIGEDCILNASDQVIQVETVKGMLYIKSGMGNVFPNLKEVNYLNISRNNSELIAPKLLKLRKQSIILGKFSAENLEELNIDNTYYFQHDLPKLKSIQGNLIARKPYFTCEQYTTFKYLKVISGDFHASKSIETPDLEHVFGQLDIDNYQPELSQLKTIGELKGDPEIKAEYVLKHQKSLKRILTSEYFEVNAPGLVKSFYHKIRENEYITRSKFYIKSWRFEQSVISLKEYTKILKMRHQSYQNFITREVNREWLCKDNPDLNGILKKIKRFWKIEEAYSIKSLFLIENQNIRRFAFNYVGVSELMKSLKAKRIATDGIKVKYFEYNALGEKKTVKKHNIFETYCADLNQFEDLKRWSWDNNPNYAYAVKCWCTSTNEEHWLWIEEQYKDKPLEAIASTFRIHKNVIPYIKCLKRQGDVLICEMSKQVIPEGEIIPLTAKQYFELLVAES